MKSTAPKPASPRVQDVMTRHLVTTTPDMPVTAAADMMAHHRIGALPVLDGAGQLLGLLTAADIVWLRAHQIPIAETQSEGPEPVEPTMPEAASYWYHLGLAEARRRLAEHAEPGPDPTVSEVYSPGAITVDARAEVSEAARLMGRHRVHHLAVVEQGKLRGLVSTLDVVRAYSAH